MENTYQNPPAPMNGGQPNSSRANQAEDQSTGVTKHYVKATPPSQRRPSVVKTLLALIGLVGFFGLGMAGVLVSQQQYVSQAPVAPNVPESRPEASIQQASCTLTFTVSEPEPLICGESSCEVDDDCDGDLICVTADDGEGYCAQEEYEEACADDPSTTSCCEEPGTTPTPTPTDEPTPTPTPTDEPTPTPELLTCGESGCEDNFDCKDNLVCITADDGESYCADSDFKTACADNPSTTNCCEEPGEETTPTPTFVVTTTGGQPDLPEELPVAGPEDWLKYLQAGLATLGVGALLLLLL